jgi:hypothetical protein
VKKRRLIVRCNNSGFRRRRNASRRFPSDIHDTNQFRAIPRKHHGKYLPPKQNETVALLGPAELTCGKRKFDRIFSNDFPGAYRKSLLDGDAFCARHVGPIGTRTITSCGV